MIIKLPGDTDSPSIILNGHADVVSPEPVSDWKLNPLGVKSNGTSFTAGEAGDMKVGRLANFFTLKAILKAGLRPKGKVILQSVVDEEAGGAGGTAV